MAENAITVSQLQIEISYKQSARTKKQIAEAKKQIKEVGKEGKNSSSKVGKMFESLKRIATYRLLRTAIKEITAGLREGVTNLYQWSKASDQTFSKAMDRMSTSLLYLKNSFGALLGGMLEVFEPIFTRFVDAVANAVGEVSHFMSVIMGTPYYYKATKSAKEFAAAQRQLLSFDELNILGKNQADYASMFEKVYRNGAEQLKTNAELKIGLDKINFFKGDADETSMLESLRDTISKVAAGAVLLTGLTGGMTPSFAFGALLTIGLISAYFANDGMDFDSSLAEFESMLGGLAGGALAFKLSQGNPVITVVGAILGFSIGLIKFASETGQTAKAITSLLIGALGGLAAAGIAVGLLGAGATAAATIGLTVGAILTIAIFKTKFDTKENKVEDLYKGSAIQMPELEGKVLAEKPKSLLGGIFGFANGGIPAQGSMFIAGETGDPEFVGNVGGRTSVYNSDQLANSLAGANENVVNAIYQAVNLINAAIANQPTPSIKIGDREIYQAAERGKTLSGRSLIQGA